MNELFEQLALCIEFGKINQKSPFPPSMRGQEGADELTIKAIEQGLKPSEILDSLIKGMNLVGQKFSENKVFVPEMLMAAKAMSTSMAHLKPFFSSGEIKRKGTFVVCTVMGDLHDIGKNLVAMTIEGAGWEVIDLGVDVRAEKILETLKNHPDCVVGLSALLTTTMINMESIVKEIKTNFPDTKVLVGGAPLSADFCKQIGADFYSRDPQGAVEFLNQLAAA